MKILINKKQIEKVIERNYLEELDFKGTAVVSFNGNTKKVSASMTGKIKINSDELVAKYEIEDEEIKTIVKNYLEKAGYEVNSVLTKTSKGYEDFYDQEGYLDFESIEADVKNKVKEKVVKKNEICNE